jgi:hypothetical protein
MLDRRQFVRRPTGAGHMVVAKEPCVRSDTFVEKRTLAPDDDLSVTGSFTGEGAIAATAHGQPMVVPVTPMAPVFLETDAIIGWPTPRAAASPARSATSSVAGVRARRSDR